MFGIDGLNIGTAENLNSITGCTVLLFESGAVASVDIRGASPGTRETALLAPDKQMERIDAILLTGGSAFGLDAASGVVAYLADQRRGYPTPWRNVPIVPAAVIFDLNIGSSSAYPDAAMGRAACEAAAGGSFPKGSRGAGTGATVGKWAGIDHAMKSGQGIGTRSSQDVSVAALAVVNAVGDIYGSGDELLAGAQVKGEFIAKGADMGSRIADAGLPGVNTTLAAVVTNAKLTKTELNRIAQRCHDSLARRIVPVHTSFDGDTVFSVSSGLKSAPFEFVAALAADAVSDAIVDAVKSAQSLGGYPSFSDLIRKT